MAFTFDGTSKIITLTSGTTTMSVRDVWSRWVDWQSTSDNSKYLPAFEQVGGNDIDVTSGTSIPIYAFLINGWRLKPQEANHTLNVNDGILLVSGGGDPFINTTGSFIVRINYSQPVQAITVATGGGSGGGGLTTEQAEQLERIDSRVDIKVSESVGGGGGGIGFGQIQYIIEEVLKEYDKKPKEKIDENEKEYIMELEKKIDGLYTYIGEVKTKIPGAELGAETLVRIKSLEEFIRKKENKTQEEKEMIKGLKKATKEIIEMMEKEEQEKEELAEELKKFITSLI